MDHRRALSRTDGMGTAPLRPMSVRGRSVAPFRIHARAARAGGLVRAMRERSERLEVHAIDFFRRRAVAEAANIACGAKSKGRPSAPRRRCSQRAPRRMFARHSARKTHCTQCRYGLTCLTCALASTDGAREHEQAAQGGLRRARSGRRHCRCWDLRLPLRSFTRYVYDDFS